MQLIDYLFTDITKRQVNTTQCKTQTKNGEYFIISQHWLLIAITIRQQARLYMK